MRIVRSAALELEVQSQGDLMDLINRFYRAVERGGVDEFREILSPQWVELPPVYPGQAPGPGAYMPVVEGIRAGLPDVSIEILEVIEAPPKFVVRSLLRGTHAGPFLGRPATGKTLEFNVIDIHEIADGQIIRTWHIEDFTTALQQIG